MTATQISARDLFRTAYDNRYTWDSAFPGYRADVEVIQGDETFRGTVDIAADLKLTIEGIDHPEVQKTLEAQLRDITVHRVRRPFEASHGENEFAYGETDETGAVEIQVSGKAMGSGYKVRDGVITHVSRPVHGMHFEIETRSVFQTGSGYVPTETDAEFFKDGQLIRRMTYTDTYEVVGGYPLLAKQVLTATDPDGTATVTEIRFLNLALR
ncbi:MAG: DUF3386 domain-containing protein [Cyanophyceae cyanobacterium]